MIPRLPTKSRDLLEIEPKHQVAINGRMFATSHFVSEFRPKLLICASYIWAAISYHNPPHTPFSSHFGVTAQIRHFGGTFRRSATAICLCREGNNCLWRQADWRKFTPNLRILMGWVEPLGRMPPKVRCIFERR